MPSPHSPAPASDSLLGGLLFADDEAAGTDPALPLPREAMQLVMQLVSGLKERPSAPLAASYGAQAHLALDFATRTARLDPLAAQVLDGRRLLPRLVPGVAPGNRALTRDLDDLVWDIGQACGRWRLLGAGRNGWQQPLVADPALPMRRLLRLPLPLALARLFYAGDAVPVAPAQVQAACGLSVEQTRGLLQSCLLLGLLRWHWAPEAQPRQPDAWRAATR